MNVFNIFIFIIKNQFKNDIFKELKLFIIKFFLILSKFSSNYRELYYPHDFQNILNQS